MANAVAVKRGTNHGRNVALNRREISSIWRVLCCKSFFVFSYFAKDGCTCAATSGYSKYIRQIFFSGLQRGIVYLPFMKRTMRKLVVVVAAGLELSFDDVTDSLRLLGIALTALRPTAALLVVVPVSCACDGRVGQVLMNLATG